MPARSSFASYILGGDYEQGLPFKHPDYKAFWDHESDLLVYEHTPSGIKAWQYALDLCDSPTSRGERTVVFHYTTFKGAANICNAAHKNAELFASLEDKFSHFGKGIYAASKDPEAFKSQPAVLINNYWPRCGDPDEKPESPESPKSSESPANLLKANGGAGSSPDDPVNAPVLRAILENTDRKGCAAFCIPIVVETEKVYAVGRRTTPELAKDRIALGCNRWGERQWEGRDVQVITTTKERLGAPAEATLRIMKRRVGNLTDTLGAEHPDTLGALGNWAASLAALGRDSEAEPKEKERYEASCRALGREHPSTLLALSNWAVSLSRLGFRAEAMAHMKTVYEARCRALGRDHPKTCLALSTLKDFEDRA